MDFMVTVRCFERDEKHFFSHALGRCIHRETRVHRPWRTLPEFIEAQDQSRQRHCGE